MICLLLADSGRRRLSSAWLGEKWTGGLQCSGKTKLIVAMMHQCIFLHYPMEGEHTLQYLSLTATKMQSFSHTAKSHKAWEYCTFSFSKVIVWGHSLGTSIATRALVASNFTQVCTSDEFWILQKHFIWCRISQSCLANYPACALRAQGLLLAGGAPTVGRGKTFWQVSRIFLRKQL